MAKDNINIVPNKLYTFQELLDIEDWTIVYQDYINSVHLVIMRWRYGMNCYWGVPKDHPLSWLGQNLPIDVHYWFTFDGELGIGTDLYYYWFDYWHSGDAEMCKLIIESIWNVMSRSLKEWDVDSILKDIEIPFKQFQFAVKIAEMVACK